MAMHFFLPREIFSSVELYYEVHNKGTVFFNARNQTYRDLGPCKICILWRESEFGNTKSSQKQLKNHFKCISKRGAINLKHSVRNLLQCYSRTWANNA